MSDRADVVRRLAELAVRFGANVQPGQIVGGLVVRRQGGAHAGDRARGIPRRRALGRRPVLRRHRQARAARARGRGHARLHPALAARPPALALRRARRPRRARQGRRPPARSTTSTLLVPAATSFPGCPRAAASSTTSTTNWTIVPGPTEPWAQVVYPDLDRRRRARPALAGSPAHVPPGRGRPGAPPGSSAWRS